MTEISLPTITRALPASAATARSLNYRLGRLLLRNYGKCVVLILTLALVNCFWRLSSNVISDLDEARYGVAASEMLHNHSALIATYAGLPEYWNLKPPLGYWMQEVAYRAFGPTVFAMRLPAALCALGVIGLTMLVCQRWYGRRPALLAGLILTTCFGFVGHHGARSGDLDSALTLILLVAVIQVPKLVQSAPSRLLWAAMFSLGFLLKSFAVLPFVAITAVYLAWSGDWRRCRWRDWMPALGLLSSVIAGWVLARLWVDGSMYFVDRMVREDLFQRATSVIDPETTKPWGYLLVLLDRFAPWPLFILAAVLLGKMGSVSARRNNSRLVLLWAMVPFTAFSIARTQHHWYLDPTYPAWSMLAAVAGLNLMALTAQRGRVVVATLLVLGLLFCETRVLWRVGLTDRRPRNQTFLMSLQDHALVPGNETIQTEFRLSHSERFILQVVDGYRVIEPDQPQMLEAATLPNHRVLLLRRLQAAVPAGSYTVSQIIAAGADYVLIKDARGADELARATSGLGAQ